MLDTKVTIIGAGPFGLSISAHLSALGIEHVIVGRPVDTWRTHMPDGMLLKSEPYASTIASPGGKHRVVDYYKSRGLHYVDRVDPLSRKLFVDYADWFTEQLVPGVRDETVTDVTRKDGGFQVTFANGAPVFSQQVIVATGVLPYRYLPAELTGLSADLVSHTADHHDLDKFNGRKVAIVGAGQSALETAALLHEAGATVRLIARGPALRWNAANPREMSLIDTIKHPVVPLCEGWRCTFWNTPPAFRMLPQSYRLRKAPQVLGPSGSAWLKDRVDGVVDVLTSHRVRQAEAQGSGVKLVLEGPGQSTVDADHVIAGTGFRVDIARLPFLPESLRRSVKSLGGYPLLSRAGQTSVPGLYFAGAPALISVGPSSRFIAGTHTLPKVLSKSVAQRARASRLVAQSSPGRVPFLAWACRPEGDGRFTAAPLGRQMNLMIACYVLL